VSGRALAFALTLIGAGLWLSPAIAALPSQQDRAPWRKTESPRFEIHYIPALERDLARVTRSAERAYDRISGRLSFTLETKVPLVMYATSGTLTREEVVTYATSDDVAPQHPHRSRIVLPLPERDADLDALMVHELTHLLVGEILVPHAPGDGGVPRWIHEGIASYMTAAWSGDHERLMRELVASDQVPALSQLTGDAGFTNARLNEALGHAAFDYIESRWGSTSIRRFLNSLIVPRVDKTYDAVFDLTPAQFDAAFRQYAERRFRR
jgi:hypothetical protein